MKTLRYFLALLLAMTWPAAAVLWTGPNASSGGGGGSGISAGTALTMIQTNIQYTGEYVDCSLPPYSAACDGTTDDTLAVWRASTNGSVTWPRGRTCIIANLYLSNDCWIKIPAGTTVKAKAGTTGVLIEPNTWKLNVRGPGWLQGLTTAAQNVGNFSYAIPGGALSGVRLYGNGPQASVSEVKFKGFNGAAVICDGPANDISSRLAEIVVSNCHFTNNYHSVYLGIDTADYTLIVGNYMAGNFSGFDSLCANFSVVGNLFVDNRWSTIVSPWNAARGFGLISGNTINHSGGSGGLGNSLYCNASAGNELFFSGNKLAGGADITFHDSANAVIQGNHFANAINITNDTAGRTNYFSLNSFPAAPVAYGAGSNTARLNPLSYGGYWDNQGIPGSAVDIVFSTGLTPTTNGHQVTVTASGGGGGTALKHVNTTQIVYADTDASTQKELIDATTTIAGGTLTAGTVISWEVKGSYSDPDVDNPVMTFDVKYGTVSLCTVTVNPTLASSSDWTLKGTTTFRAIGASGTAVTTFHWMDDSLDIVAPTSFPVWPITTHTETGTLDTTASTDLHIDFQYGSSSPGNWSALVEQVIIKVEAP